MTSDESAKRRGGRARLSLGLMAFEVFACASVLLVFGLFERSSLLIVSSALALRVAAWQLHLHRLWRPISTALSPAVEVETPALLAADTAAQRLPRRFGLGYAVGWLACLVGVAQLGRAGIPIDAGIGEAELIAITAAASSLAVGAGAVIAPLARRALRGPIIALGATLRARATTPTRPERSIASILSGTATMLVISSWLSAASLGGMARVHGLREAAVEVQRARAELSAAAGPAAIAERFEEVQLVAGDVLPPQLHAASTDTRVAYDILEGRALAAAPLADGRWALAQTRVDEQLRAWVLIMVGFVVVCAPSLWLLIRAATRPLWATADRLGELARRIVEDGQLEPSERVAPLANDELGRLARYFSQLQDMLDELSQTANAVADGDLRVELEHPGELHDAFRRMVQQLAVMVRAIGEASTGLARAAGEIHLFAIDHVAAADQQSAIFTNVTTMVNSLARAADDITLTASTVLVDAEQTVTTTDQMITQIHELGTQAEGIGELVGQIGEIASRSDLLALNGSLEATRAGEAGRGFALVASEMRRLAERVTSTLVDVDVRVTGIHSSGRSTVMATETSRALAQRTADAARAISEVTRRQSVDTEQVSSEVDRLATMLHDADDEHAQLQDASARLREQAAELERLIGHFALAAHARADSESFA